MWMSDDQRGGTAGVTLFIESYTSKLAWSMYNPWMGGREGVNPARRAAKEQIMGTEKSNERRVQQQRGRVACGMGTVKGAEQAS
jgi:hypothetical protein